MADISQLTRSGTIGTQIHMRKLRNADGTLTPFCYFDVDSEIGGATETLRVLMQGQLCEEFADMEPKTGDRILVRQATPYVKDGQLCTRLLEKDQIQVASAGGLASDVSRLTQSGIIGSEIHLRKLKKSDGSQTPFCYFDVVSSLAEGSTGTPAEPLQVLIQGELCEYFMELHPATGDRILLLHAVPYVKEGHICTRLQSKDQVQLMPDKRELFGLPAEAFISARALFGGNL